MGVDGFLRGVKEAVDDTHLRQFAGQTLVVDALSWLHKACYGCAFDLSTGRDTDTYVRYMLRKVDMMRGCGVAKVVLVFDGQRLPLKASTHEKRQSLKEDNRKRALQAMAAARRLEGVDRQAELNQAYQHFQRSVSVTSEIVANVMDALRAAMVPFVVAPFEADAQMVWMCKEGLATGIVTEDSDVVVYCLTANVPCPVIVKLDDNGSAQAVSRSIIHKNSKGSSNALMKKLHFFTSGEKEATRMFVQICVLAGCDFIDSLPNVGFATAVKHIFNFRGAPGHLRVPRLVSKLSSGGTKVPSDFMERFVKAEAIFFHHIVFNPKKRSCEFLINSRHENCFADIFQRVVESLGMEPESETASTAQQEDLHTSVTSGKSFLGKIHSRDIVEGIYNGEISPRTLRSFSEVGKATEDAERLKPYSVPQPMTEASSFASDVHIVSKSSTTTERSSSHVARREVPVMTPQQIENKKRAQEQERQTSFHNLVSMYTSASAGTNKVQALASQTSPASNQGGSPDKPSASVTVATASARILSSTSTVVKASKQHTTSFKDLIAKHSFSSQPAGSPSVPDLNPRAAPPTTSDSRKRPAPKPPSSSTRKTKQKTSSGTSGKTTTLLQFFQKQS